MFAAHSGSTRSKAAAKMTRVDERNRVPAQPKNQRPMTAISSAWKRWLPTNQPASMIGYGQIGTGGARGPGAQRLVQERPVAGWEKSPPTRLSVSGGGGGDRRRGI